MEDAHELHGYFEGVARSLALAYARIRDRVAEDPGTAGDRAEENWAEVLRSWLPQDLRVVTKGRILGYDGATSPQVDIVVLDSGYPLQLNAEKLYLAGGVVAAFECKLTLRRRDLRKAFSTLRAIKEIGAQLPTRREAFAKETPSLIRELSSPIICGLLAHSHELGRHPIKPRSYWRAYDVLEAAAYEEAKSPLELPDLICVADLVLLTLSKLVAIGPVRPRIGGYDEDELSTTYFAQRGTPRGGVWPSIVGGTVFFLLSLLARQRPSLRRLADYYYDTGLQGIATGAPREWPIETLSAEVRKYLRERGGSLDHWSEWSIEL
jgi:hypothetical protein